MTELYSGMFLLTLKKTQAVIAKEQELNNFIHLGEFRHAMLVAFELDHPHTMLKVLKKLTEDTSQPQQAKDEVDGVSRMHSVSMKLHEVANAFTDEEIVKCLRYIREWNSNARNCHVAQLLLREILLCHPPQKLRKIRGIRDLVDGMVPYTERHLRRLGGLLRQCFLIEYTLRCAGRGVAGARFVILSRSLSSHLDCY